MLHNVFIHYCTTACAADERLCLLAPQQEILSNKCLSRIHPTCLAALSSSHLQRYSRERNDCLFPGQSSSHRCGSMERFLYPIAYFSCNFDGALLLPTPPLRTDPEQRPLRSSLSLSLSKVVFGKEIAMIFSLMLRFIPTRRRHAIVYFEAQTARAGRRCFQARFLKTSRNFLHYW